MESILKKIKAKGEFSDVVLDGANVGDIIVTGYDSAGLQFIRTHKANGDPLTVTVDEDDGQGGTAPVVYPLDETLPQSAYVAIERNWVLSDHAAVASLVNQIDEIVDAKQALIDSLEGDTARLQLVANLINALGI